MRRLTIGLALAGLLGALAGGAALAGTITFIDAPGAYVTTCGGGVVGVTFGSDNDLTAQCLDFDTQVVICGGGEIDWTPGTFPDEDQITVTCRTPK